MNKFCKIILKILEIIGDSSNHIQKQKNFFNIIR